MTLARNRVRRVMALGPLAVSSGDAQDGGLSLRLGGRGLEVAQCLRELGCYVELITALNATTLVGRYAVREVQGRGFGTRYLAHDDGLSDLGGCGTSTWGGSAALLGVLRSALAGCQWLVCDGSLGSGGLAIVDELVAGGELRAVGMGSGAVGSALLSRGVGWQGLCLDRTAWRAAGCGADGYRGLSVGLGSTALRVELGNGVSLTLRGGDVLGYGVWRGLAAETAALTGWLMGEA